MNCPKGIIDLSVIFFINNSGSNEIIMATIIPIHIRVNPK